MFAKTNEDQTKNRKAQWEEMEIPICRRFGALLGINISTHTQRNRVLVLLKLIQTCIVVTLIPIDLTPNGFQFNSKSIGRL